MLTKGYRPTNPKIPQQLSHTQTPPNNPVWHRSQNAQQSHVYNCRDQRQNNYGLTPEQYFSLKIKAVDIQALNTRLFYDLIRQNRTPATIILTYLVSNCDLVVHSIVSLSLQRLYVSKESILCTFKTLQNMTHSVRTAFGGSKSTYGGYTWDVPLKPPPQGLVQLNGSVPAIWSIVSTPLINCIREAVHVAAFKCCISGNTTSIVVYWFIDNSIIVQIYPFTDTHTENTVKLDQ